MPVNYVLAATAIAAVVWVIWIVPPPRRGVHHGVEVDEGGHWQVTTTFFDPLTDPRSIAGGGPGHYAEPTR